ncbi:hypothetical protein MMC22_008574 [Lobaria immixta]|nr:hypothetical protein [Lobaria immixta]
MGAEASGPDNHYIKAIRKRDIKVDPKLSTSNYLSWAKDIQLLLEAKKLWRLVNSKVPIPAKHTRPSDYKEWIHNDTQASGPNKSINNIVTALENIKLEIADIQKTHKLQDFLVVIALISAIEDPAYNIAKFLLEQESDLTLEVAKESLKVVQQKLKDEKKEAIKNAYHTKAKSKGLIIKYWLDNTKESQEWKQTHSEQKQKSKKAKSNSSKSNTANNSSKSTNNCTSSNAANSSKSYCKSQGAAQAANKDKTDKDESEDERWMAIDEENIFDVKETIYSAENIKTKFDG